MPVQKYSNYLEVNPLFESVVDIDADQRNPHLWQEYIVGQDMQNLVEFLCQSLGNGQSIRSILPKSCMPFATI